MRVRVSEGIPEGQCSACREWKALGAYGAGSAAAWTRSVEGAANWYWNAGRAEWKAMCKACEAERKRARRATGQLSRRGRVFGIEMELTGPDSRAVIQALLDAGIRMDPRNASTGSELGYAATNTDQHVWTLKHDGSVSGRGLELVSPKLSGEAGYREVETVCAALNSVGATVNASTGLHVHHDFRNVSVADAQRQVLAFVERQELIATLVAPSRRSNGYCRMWNASEISSLQAFRGTLRDMAYVGPRGSLNLQSYPRHGSVEIRFHGGSTNARKILAWIRFGQAIFAAGQAEAPVSDTNVEQMLQDLSYFGLTTTDAATLLRFRRVGETRSAIERTLLEAQRVVDEAADLLTEVA